MDDKEFNITDTVYVMYDNKPIKGVITHKIRVNTTAIDIPDRLTYDNIKKHNVDILRQINSKNEVIYRISIIPPDPNNVDFQPINGAFYADALFGSFEELINYLAETPV